MKKNRENESWENAPEKVISIYKAVLELFQEGADVHTLSVSQITGKAGIGKGTVYDYFDSKDEIIVSALLNSIGWICTQVGIKFKKLSTFKEKLEYILDVVEQHMGERECFMRFIHLISGNSSISLSLKEAMQKQCNQEYAPEWFLDDMVDTGLKSGELTQRHPRYYMKYIVGGKLIAYILYLEESSHNEYGILTDRISPQEMRELLYQSIIKEFCVEEN